MNIIIRDKNVSIWNRRPVIEDLRYDFARYKMWGGGGDWTRIPRVQARDSCMAEPLSYSSTVSVSAIFCVIPVCVREQSIIFKCISYIIWSLSTYPEFSWWRKETLTFSLVGLKTLIVHQSQGSSSRPLIPKP